MTRFSLHFVLFMYYYFVNEHFGSFSVYAGIYYKEIDKLDSGCGSGIAPTYRCNIDVVWIVFRCHGNDLNSISKESVY